MSSSSSSEWRDWSSLPEDLLLLILERLRWSSHPSVAAVCSPWCSAVPPSYPAWITPLLLNAADVGTTNIRYYSPYFHKNFEIDRTLTDPGAKICCSAAEHLTTLCTPDDVVLDADMVSGSIRELPRLPDSKFNFIVYDDGALRTTMYAIDTVGSLRICRTGLNDDSEWDDWDLVDSPDEQMVPTLPISNPVFHGGMLYLLGKDGRLALYDPCNHERGFEIHDKPESFGFETDDSYLVESEQGELMAILVGRRGTPVHIVKLNEEAMKWEEVESLQGRTLFTGTLTTMMRSVKIKWMQNKVFLPKLYDWPETIQVNLVLRDGELAFVPKSGGENTILKDGEDYMEKMWCYEPGQRQAKKFWGTKSVDYGIWVNFST